MVQMNDERTCPRCGMPQSEWRGNSGAGVEQDGERYCCQGCADGTGCTCRQQGEVSSGDF